MKKNKRYLAPVLAAFVIFSLYLYVGKIFSAETAGAVMGVLSDGFFAASVLVGGIGLISFAGKFGTFDMLSYGTRSFFGNFFHSLRDDLPKTFYDYKVKKGTFRLNTSLSSKEIIKRLGEESEEEENKP